MAVVVAAQAARAFLHCFFLSHAFFNKGKVIFALIGGSFAHVYPTAGIFEVPACRRNLYKSGNIGVETEIFVNVCSGNTPSLVVTLVARSVTIQPHLVGTPSVSNSADSIA